MILEVPDEYKEAFIGFLELGLTYIEHREQELQEDVLVIVNTRTGAASKERVQRTGRGLELADDELAVIETVKQFIEEHENSLRYIFQLGLKKEITFLKG